MLLRSGRPHEAEASLAKTVLAHPGSSDAHICLARALLERSAVDLAIPHLERAVALTPTSAQAHLLLAKAYMRKGRAQDAQPHFDAAARSAQ